MQYLRQSTNTTIVVGPFLSQSDGYTPLTSLTIASGAFRLSKNGASFVGKNSGGISHTEYGWYSGQLNTVDTNSVGNLIVNISGSGALPVWREYTVLPSGIYDSFVSGVYALPSDIRYINGDATNGNNATLKLKQLHISSSSPSPIYLASDSVPAIDISTGSSNKAVSIAASNGVGLSIVGSSNNSAVLISGSVYEPGLVIRGGASSTKDIDSKETDRIASIGDIVASGDAAGWDATAVITDVTVSGFTPGALSEIVASGNAAGWSSTDVDVGSIVSGVWEHTIDITDAENALKLILAYTTGNTSRTGTTYTYRNYDDSLDVLTISGSNDGRDVTKI